MTLTRWRHRSMYVSVCVNRRSQSRFDLATSLIDCESMPAAQAKECRAAHEAGMAWVTPGREIVRYP
jgi:hypothetical protein